MGGKAIAGDLTRRAGRVNEFANHSQYQVMLIERITQLMVASGAAWVLWLLFGLSAVCLAIAIERAWELRRGSGDVAALVPLLRKLLRSDRAAAARLLATSAGLEARVVAAGLADADRGAAAAEEAMAAAMGLERKRLEKRLLFLGTVGNNAPFVGLLGTVIGVVGAFEELGKPQALSSTVAGAASLAPERVMGTIAEALVATAVGLVVAIPVVAIFNYFQGRVGAALADAETLGHVLLAHLRSNPGSEPERPSAATSMAAEDVASDLPLPDVADAIAE
jgi:biopolymer transport protein ExbB